MKKIRTEIPQRHAIAAAALVALFGSAQAADWEVSGMIRQELAVKTTDDQNNTNQYGNAQNGISYTNNGVAAGLSPTLTRPGAFKKDADINWFATRLELNFDGKLSESLKATIKLRGILDETRVVDDAYGTRTAGGINTGSGNFLSGSSFRQQFGGTAGGPLAYATDRALIDLPAAYVDYNNGPLWIRAGNQQIAWGEALFFRVADQPNGLDLRGHLFGVAAEEYSDTRRSALGLRMNYRVNEETDVDGFVQRFAPSLLPNGETAYNVIQDQFTVDQKPGYDDVKNKWNVGFRVKGEAGGFGYQAFAVNRTNPDGVFKWSAAKGDGVLPGTAFAVNPTGVYNAAEWFKSAANSRLDGIEGVATSMNFIGTNGDPYGLVGLATACGASRAELGNFQIGSQAAAACILDTFFTPGVAGPLRGWLSREYKRETVFGGGINRVFEGEPDSLLDQLIGRFEFSYTPNKHFTNPTLGDYIKKDEYQFALILEKYHKFTSAFPATYFVAQWLHKSRSDLFGRYLGGVDNQPGSAPNGQSGGFNAVAIALQQPSPTLEYRFDFSVLTDLKGGWYMQPGVKWKPTKSVQADLYLNAVYSQNKGEYKDFVDGLQHNNEIFARVSYQF
ncbi:DUF1302 family protein [Methylibium petroleiphilum]|uniref:DUF1302 family protein n=1 Tax=Methylibium petroleiphilum TaxID=105560 RepID=UPI003D285CB9